ncbi:MAG: ATP-dependent acyl-CoA ligase [Gammaproteobacteria bacterium]|nr:ATP-dependent acyl-CoA ligase [Gammaproteobacteria bacterium]
MASSVAACFANSALVFGERPFLHIVSETAKRYQCEAGLTSYQDFSKLVSALAIQYEVLLKTHEQTQIRVALGLDNRPEFFLHWLALNSLGVSVVPLNPQWQSAELEYVLTHSEVRYAVVLPEHVAKITAAVRACTSLQDTCHVRSSVEFEYHPSSTELTPRGSISQECALLYTSGTTGKPKACILSNEYFLSSGEWYVNVGGYCAFTPGQERLITPLPMYHMNAMATSTMAMMTCGGCIIPLDRFHPTTWWQSVKECDATIMHYLGVMPVMLMSLPASAQDQSNNIRFGFGAGLSGELHTAFEQRFGTRLIEAWAMTETGCTVAVVASEEPRKVGTACFGKPPEHLDYRLVDEQENDVPQGQPGELWVRHSGDNPRYGFFSGYLKDQDATNLAWQGGYFHTGDLVYLDNDGLMHFVDRKKNIIRRSGENISAVEVEEVLLEHPMVEAVGVAPVPDAVRGDEVCACVTTTAAVEDWPQVAIHITNHCLGRLSYYKAPGYLVQLAELPLTATKKIQRANLKKIAISTVADNQCVDTRHLKKHRA